MRVLGFDIGGTNVAYGIIEENKELLEKGSFPTPETTQSLLEGLYEIIHQCMPVDGIGIGIPGILDPLGRKVIHCVNAPLSDLALSDILEEKWKVPVKLGNDATVATLAEWVYGGLQGINDGMLLTFGTGIGGGLILNGQSYLGATSQAFEPGHMVIKPGGRRCSCGRRGCFETQCSASRLMLRFEDLTGQRVSSAKEIFDGYLAQEKKAKALIEDFTDDLILGITNLVNLFNPKKIVLTGGLSQSFSLILDALRQGVKEAMIFDESMAAEIVISELQEAGILGAGVLIQEHLNQPTTRT